MGRSARTAHLGMVSASALTATRVKYIKYLLRNHNNESRKRSAAHARDGEKLDEPRKVVGPAQNGKLLHELAMNVVQIAGGLQLGVAEALEGGVGVMVAALLHEPTRRFCEKER